MNKSHTTPGVAFLFIVLITSGDYTIVLGHLVAQFDGVVVSRADFVHYPVWTRNLTTRYVLREADGREYVYHADPSQGPLEGFPVGARLTKLRWHMDYEEDGRARNDFPLAIYILPIMLESIVLVAGAILIIRIGIRERRDAELQAAVERARRRLETDQ